MSVRALGLGPKEASGQVVSTAARGALLIGLVAFLGCAGGTSSRTGRRSPVRACRTSQLHGSFARLDAGAGQRYVPLVLTNVAKDQCSISGYPSLQLAAVDGRGIPTEVVQIDTGSVTRLTISPGHRASSLLHWIGIPLNDEAQTGPCEPTPVRAAITPPGEVQPLSVKWSFDAVCGHGQIEARPMQAGVPSG
jgi:Protein of unknown function (DUF4232)